MAAIAEAIWNADEPKPVTRKGFHEAHKKLT